jgi:hypothetical protein
VRRNLTGGPYFGGGERSSGFSARGEKEKGSERVRPLAGDGERGNGWVATFKSQGDVGGGVAQLGEATCAQR